MSMNQRVRSGTCWAIFLLWRKICEKEEKLLGWGWGVIEGDLGTVTTERALDAVHRRVGAFERGLGLEFLV